MATPRLVGVGASVSGTAAVTAAYPAGYTAIADDVATIWREMESGDTITVPAGWAIIASQTVSSGTVTKLSVIGKRLTAGEAAPSLTDAGNHQVARMAVWRGCRTDADPWSITGGTTELTADTSVSIPGLTTTRDNCVVMAAFSTGQDIASTAGATAWANSSLDDSTVTEIMDNWVSAGLGGGFAVAWGTKAVAGSVSATTATLSLTSNFKALISVCLEGVLDAGPQLTVAETSWTTTSTPKTITDAGVVSGDRLLHLGGGDQDGTNDVTAATSSTSTGSTSAWTELVEDLTGTQDDWIHAAHAS